MEEILIIKKLEKALKKLEDKQYEKATDILQKLYNNLSKKQSPNDLQFSELLDNVINGLILDDVISLNYLEEKFEIDKNLSQKVINNLIDLGKIIQIKESEFYKVLSGQPQDSNNDYKSSVFASHGIYSKAETSVDDINDDELYVKIKSSLKSGQPISIRSLNEEYNLGYVEGCKIIDKLVLEGLIRRDDENKFYVVN